MSKVQLHATNDAAYGFSASCSVFRCVAQLPRAQELPSKVDFLAPTAQEEDGTEVEEGDRLEGRGDREVKADDIAV